MTNRVAVTGIGAISPLGLDIPTMWQALLEGKTGIDYITHFDTTGFEVTFAAEVEGFDAHNYMDRKEARHTDRFVQFAIAAAREAVEQSRLEIGDHNANDIGVIIGSGIGGIGTLSEQLKNLLERGPSRVSPFLIPMMITDMAAGLVSMYLGARGPNYCTTSACASGAHAIGDALEYIRRGDAQAIITGGAEASITPIGVAGFAAARALSTRNDAPKIASRPFDAQRDGFVMGEGAAVLVLENLDIARRRGASILAEIVGAGATGDAYHITQPREGGEGGVRAMRLALRQANLKPEDVDYINAHGTSTPLNDKYETMAIKTVLGENAYRIPISSTKSMMGHLLGAAGAVEATICVQTIRHDVVPPTINITCPDPECDLDYVPDAPRHTPVRVAMSNSLGFGGHNSTLVFKKYVEE